ncbi:MAG: prolyl oligopeptidase family serine peptidase [Candidatus Hydrogenedens sp.]|nr:prolyl oligopeptidase family serine peptidase [Candidatus Hydrogenedens sp.]
MVSRRLWLWFACVAFAFAWRASAGEVIQPADTLPETTPWDLIALSEAPAFRWAQEDGPVRSLYYTAEAYEGHDTEVFAYYASPATISGETPADHAFPAVVLVHGGGGTAFPQWARLWAERGYAAIAMDLAGKLPSGERLPNGGPDQGDDTKFGKIDSALTDQWTYQAVANVILAHSLIRNFPEVDADRTAVTGISWGGYLTCIVAGLDNRFKAAVPVYGCGYLEDGSAWLGQFAAMTEAQRAKWTRYWDPSAYVGAAAMPVFFVNGTNDFAYWLEIYAKTYGLVRGERNLRITVIMPHGHEVGWAPEEIGLFVDQYLRGGPPLPKLALAEAQEGKVAANVQGSAIVVSGELHYTIDHLPNPDRTWTTIPATVSEGRLEAAAPPDDATIWFFTATGDDGAIVSSELGFAKPEATLP